MGKQLMIVARYSDDSTPESTTFHLDKIFRKNIIRNKEEKSFKLGTQNDEGKPVRIIPLCLDVRVASYFRCELMRSHALRRRAWIHLASQSSSTHLSTIIIQILLKPPIQYYIDQRFGFHVQLLVNERIELDNIMSCLSTLGGAFSSLGDQFLDCAKTAGRISLQQYKIAEKLCDPITLMRCQLYLAISFIQCNYFTNARIVITSVYNAMKSRPKELQDKRVISMCLGIWAKFKYHWYLEKKKLKMTHYMN